MFRPRSIAVAVNNDGGFHSLNGPSPLFTTLVHCNLFNHAKNGIPSNDSLLIPAINFFMNMSNSRMGCQVPKKSAHLGAAMVCTF
jgi:hypothetical protein